MIAPDNLVFTISLTFYYITMKVPKYHNFPGKGYKLGVRLAYLCRISKFGKS